MIKKFKKFWKDSGLNAERTLEEELVHAVNSLAAEGDPDLAGVYNHEDYVAASKVMYDRIYGVQDE